LKVVKEEAVRMSDGRSFHCSTSKSTIGAWLAMKTL